MVEKKRVSSPAENECRKIPLGVVSQLRRQKIKNIHRKRSEIGQRRFNREAKTNTDVAGDVRDSYEKKNDDDSSTEISVSVSSFSDQLSEKDVDLAGNGDRSRSKIDTCESYGVVSMIGRRREMEDTVSVKLGFLNRMDYDYDFFGVYDGHGGSRVAEACEKRLHCVVAEEIANNTTAASEGGETVDWEKVMVVSFEKMDEEVNCNGGGDGTEVSASMGRTTGSTAVVVVVGKEEMVVANCGDSRAIISRGGVAVALSIDHKPDRPDELERVEAAGGRVINWNGYRVLGVLATSRSIGDQYLKPYVTSKPEVTVITRTDTDEFIILASDGLWDVISNEIACQVVRRCLDGRLKRRSQTYARGRRAPEAAAVLAELAIARGSKDNISVIVVELRKGDQYLKPYVTSKPEVTVITRTDTDEFLILASDGLWDVISNEIACQVVRRCLDGRLKRRSQTYASGRRAPEATAVLAELAIARGSKDNISVIVVELRKGRHYLC